MARPSHHWRALGICWLFAGAWLLSLGSEFLRPGHHIHIGSGERLHHHHFFLGNHSHDKPSSPKRPFATVLHHRHSSTETHDHGQAQHAHQQTDRSQHHPEGSEEPNLPQDQGSSSTGLITTLVLDLPSSVFNPRVVIDIEISAARDLGLPTFTSPVFLPNGARAPPTTFLI